MKPFFRALLLILLCVAPHAAAVQETVSRQEAGKTQTANENPYAILKSCKRIFILARSEYFSPEALEREIIKHPEIQRWGIVIARNREEAELVLEVTRKKFTTRFTISLIEPLLGHVLAGDRASSIGGTIEPRLADRLVRLLKPHREAAAKE